MEGRVSIHSPPSCFQERNVGGEWRRPLQGTRAGSSLLLAFIPLMLLPLEGLLLPEYLLTKECKEGPRICKYQMGSNPGVPATADRILGKLFNVSEPYFPHL